MNGNVINNRMSVAYDIKLTVDDTAVNRSLAQINQNIAQIGARSTGAPGVSALNAQLQQTIAQNPAVARVITSMGNLGSASSRSSNQVHGLVAQLQALGANNPQIAAIAAQLQGMGGAANNAASRTSGLFGSLGSSAQAAMSSLTGMQGSLAGVATAGAALGVTAVVGGLVAVGAAAVNASAKFEAYRASLTTVLGSSDKAGQAFDRLVQFAAQTPFSLDQSVEGFIKLKALGLQPSERAMISYGNTASAMGKDLNQMVEAVADAATGENERLKEFGITASKSANETAFTFQGVTTKVKNNATDIQAYLMKIGETNFAGAMAKQMETFNGATSNLSDTVQQTLAKIGDGLNKPIAGVINMITSGLSAIAPVLASIGTMFGGLISGITSIVSGVASVFAGIAGGGSRSITIIEAITVAFNLVGQGLSVFGSLVGSVFGFFGQLIGSVTEMWRSSFGNVLGWMGVSFETGGRSWGNSILGVLRAVKTVVGLMPQLFSVAINDVMKMFRSLGSVVGRLLSGDLTALKDIGGAITGSFANTAKAIGAVGRIGMATYRDEKGASAAWGRLKGEKKTSGASLADLAGAAPKPTPAAGKSDKDKDRDDAAKKAAERLKNEREFWQALQQSATVAAMLPREAERYNEEMKLRKILGDGEIKDAIQLNDLQKKRIADALALKSMNEVLRDTKLGIQSADIEAQRIQARIAATTGLTGERAAENLAVEEKLWPIKKAALEKGISLADAELQKQLAILGAKERQNFAAERANQLAMQRRDDAVAYAVGAVATDGTKADKRALATATRDKQIASLNEVRANLSPEQFRAGVNRAAREFRETIGQAADAWGTKFGGVLNELGQRIGGKLGQAVGAGGDVASAIGGFGADQKASSEKIAGLFNDPKSKLATGIGNAVGGAMAGLQIGEKIGQLGKALGIKNFESGAKIGGFVGGLTGNPILAAGASVIGGLLSSIFTKAKSGSAVLTGPGQSSVTANNSAFKDALTGTANSVQEGLAQIAQQMGGKVGAYRVSIGKREDYFRVDADGSSRVSAKHPGSGLLYDGKDEAKAIAIAIKNAIEDGAITGLGDFAQKALQKLGVDGAISAVRDFNAAMSDLTALTDPVGAAIRAVVEPLDTLKTTMLNVGASASDLAKLEQYRTAKLDAAYKEQTKTFDDLLETLRGEGSGTTALSRFNSDMDKFKSFQNDVKAGKAVDKDAFASLATKLMSGSKELYGGSTSQQANIVAMLTETTLAAKNLVTSQFPSSIAQDATVSAINQGNAEVVTSLNNTNAAISINNGYQERILEAIENLGTRSAYQYQANNRVDQV